MEDSIVIVVPDGVEREFTVLYSFVSNNTNKKYVIYTDFQKEDNLINCYSAIYEDGKCLPVDTKEEQDIIDMMITTLSSNGEKYNLKEE